MVVICDWNTGGMGLCYFMYGVCFVIAIVIVSLLPYLLCCAVWFSLFAWLGLRVAVLSCVWMFVWALLLLMMVWLFYLFAVDWFALLIAFVCLGLVWKRFVGDCLMVVVMVYDCLLFINWCVCLGLLVDVFFVCCFVWWWFAFFCGLYVVLIWSVCLMFGVW